MDLKSIFHRDKALASAPLPQPPSVREMLEDIENSSKNDPIFQFATYLQRKGSRQSRMSSVESIPEAVATTPVLSSMGGRRSNSESDSISVPTTPVTLMKSPFLDMTESSGLLSDSPGSGDSTESIYAKLRQFILLNEQTQDMTAELEEKLRKFEFENKEFISNLNIKTDFSSKRRGSLS